MRSHLIDREIAIRGTDTGPMPHSTPPLSAEARGITVQCDPYASRERTISAVSGIC